MKTFAALLAGTIFLASACGDSSSRKEKENTSPRNVRISKLISPKSGSDFTIGDTIEFEVSSKKTVDSVVLEINGKSSLFTANKFSVSTTTWPVGAPKIRVTVFTDGEKEAHYPRVKLLSDITPELYGYKIINNYPHNKEHFTQGYFFKGDTLIESTGQNGQSKIMKTDLTTGKVYKEHAIDNQYFGEGSAYWNGQYIQLTWTSQTGFVYDNNFKPIKSFRYGHEGWGLTVWKDTLYVSDGSNIIHKLDPRDFSEIGKIEVYDNESSIADLNELEMIDGVLYANIYQTDMIAMIDRNTGKVISYLDCAGLLNVLEARTADVLNGIAYHPEWKKLFVTGKWWPKTFEIELVKKQ